MGVWKPFECNNKSAIAICSFKHTDSHTLTFKIGDQLEILKESKDWFYGYLISSPRTFGIFPKTYVYLFDKKDLIHADNSVNEIDALLKEWINIWRLKYEECEANKMTLMGYFKNLYNVRNIIIANRASIDEIKDHKKSAIDKILQCNNLLDLDVIAYDSFYNLLDPFKASTIYLYNELQKNSLVKANVINKHTFQSPVSINFTEENLPFSDTQSQQLTFSHQLSTTSLSFNQNHSFTGGISLGSNRTYSVNASTNSHYSQHQQRSQSSFYIKLSIENIRPSENVPNIDENVHFYVNLFSNKESIYLSENAIFDSAQMRFDNNNHHISSSSLKITNNYLPSKNTVVFSDLNEKDLRPEKDYKMYLIVYAIKNIKTSLNDLNLPMSRLYAGGTYELSTGLGSLINLSSDKRNISPSMNLFLNDCELPPLINPKILDTRLNSKEQHDHQSSKQSKNPMKDVYCTLSFKCELAEATYSEILDKYTCLKESISRKMSFPDIIMPDDYRNDFYVFVYDGEFNKAKNFEFIANLVQFVRDGDKIVEKPISLEDDFDDSDINNSSPTVQERNSIKVKRQYFLYKSLVYAKQDKPKWYEIVKISISNGKKIENIKNTYLRFLIRTHDSTATSSSSLTSTSTHKNDKIKVYGKCYLKLTNDDGSAIKDEPYLFLPITKIDQDDVDLTDVSFIRFKNVVVPASAQSITNIAQLQQQAQTKEYLRIKVNVVSTQLTQNSTLLKLLSFPSDKNPNHANYKFLQQYLDELLNVKDEQSAEIVKFLQPLFEKLIDILLDLNTKYTQSIITPDLIQKHEHDIQPLVFKILIAIFQIIDNQNKFASFRNVIDAYLNKHFSITLAHKPMFRLFLLNIGYIYDYFLSYFNKSSTKTMNNGAFNVNLNDQDDYTINIIKSMEYIFKFAFKSRELLSMYKNKNNPHSDKIDQFETDVKSIFNLLTQIVLLKNTHQSQTQQDLTTDIIDTSGYPQQQQQQHIKNIETYLMKIQSYILKNVINLIQILIDSKRFTFKTIAEFYIGFLNSKFCLNTKFLSKLVNSKLFEMQESRHLIIEPLCRTLLNFMLHETNEDQHKIDLRLLSTGQLFTELMNIIERKDIGNVSQDMNEICMCLPQLIRVSIHLKSQTPHRQIYATVIISILRIMETKHYQLLFNASNSLHLLLYMCSSLITDNIYPKDWSDLLVLRDSVILNALHNIADRISNYHLKDFNPVNKKIWHDYFDAIVGLITDPCLQLEKFSENKRKNIFAKYDDMRVKGVFDLKNMWYSLGGNKQHFIPEMIDSFLKVALIPIKQINEEIVPVFFDMINSELYEKYQNGQLTTVVNNVRLFEALIVPNKLVTMLDEYIEKGAGTYEFRDVFKKIFYDKFSKNHILRDNIEYVNKVVDLIDLLIEYRDLHVFDTSDQLKTLYLNELMNFYKGMNRNDLYWKYIDYIRKIHVNSKNNICAAHTLILHATLLNWTNEAIDTNYLRYSSYPNIKYHKDLKEMLYIDIIRYFTNGQAWENAFEFSKLLRKRYEEQYDYEKLSEVLQKEAELCQNILHKERLYSNYFLVGFYGKEFPKLLQNRQFVFMSNTLEDIGTFRPRIQSWFPQAVLLTHSNSPSDSELNAQSQFIQITKLEPIYEAKPEFINLNIPLKLRNYFQNNEVNKFKFLIRKEAKLNEDDATLWWTIERTVYITNNLPYIINFYPVKSERLIDVSPLQNAINNVKKQYEFLKLCLNDMHMTKDLKNDPHIRLIQGTLDAGVNGGLPKYIVFLSQSYVDENPDYVDLINELRDLILETIDLAETYLLWCIKYVKTSKNTKLLEFLNLFDILESEQLPKLKAKYSLPMQSNVNKKNFIEQQFDQQQQQSQRNVNLNNPETPTRKLSISDILNTSNSAKTNRKQLFASSKQSSTSLSNHRDSISSIRSANSDDDSSKTKLIVLNEQLNPIRPLRPSRINAQASSSSISNNNSNHSSRPISHISDDGTSQLSLLPENKILDDTNSNYTDENSYEYLNNAESLAPPKSAPPKPALPPHKPLNIKFKFLSNNGNNSDKGSSSQSLNEVQFRNT